MQQPIQQASWVLLPSMVTAELLASNFRLEVQCLLNKKPRMAITSITYVFHNRQPVNASARQMRTVTISECLPSFDIDSTSRTEMKQSNVYVDKCLNHASSENEILSDNTATLFNFMVEHCQQMEFVKFCSAEISSRLLRHIHQGSHICHTHPLT